MVAVLQRHTASFATTRSYSVPAKDVAFSCENAVHRVGEYVADYSELTEDEIAAPVPEMDGLLARSKVVSVKRGL